jgi:hypothetical protein
MATCLVWNASRTTHREGGDRGGRLRRTRVSSKRTVVPFPTGETSRKAQVNKEHEDGSPLPYKTSRKERLERKESREDDSPPSVSRSTIVDSWKNKNSLLFEISFMQGFLRQIHQYQRVVVSKPSYDQRFTVH